MYVTMQLSNYHVSTLSNDTESMNTGFTLCFAFQRKPEAALMHSSSSSSDSAPLTQTLDVQWRNRGTRTPTGGVLLHPLFFNHGVIHRTNAICLRLVNITHIFVNNCNACYNYYYHHCQYYGEICFEWKQEHWNGGAGEVTSSLRHLSTLCSFRLRLFSFTLDYLQLLREIKLSHKK